MLRKLALAGATLLAFACGGQAEAAICPSSLLGNVSGQNAVAAQTFLEKICANLDTLIGGGSAAGTGDVNVTQVGGATVKTGAGTASGALRVEIPTDGTGKVGLNPGSAIVGKVGIDQTTDGTTNRVNLGTGRATYSISAIGYTAYATPTDLVCISGSASKTVRVITFAIRAQSTSATLETIYWIRRSTANSGGTSTTPTPVAFDSTNAASTSVVTVYTAAPTTGTVVGNLSIIPVATTALTTAPGANSYAGVFSGPNLTDYRQTVTLRGTAESLCANFQGAALPSGWTAFYDVVWTEE